LVQVTGTPSASAAPLAPATAAASATIAAARAENENFCRYSIASIRIHSRALLCKT
jgi:hypothetical protein